jgi:hypothetical protein
MPGVAQVSPIRRIADFQSVQSVAASVSRRKIGSRRACKIRRLAAATAQTGSRRREPAD